MIYYSHRQPLNVDLSGFIPVNNPSEYQEGLRLLIDRPDFSQDVVLSSIAKKRVIQDLGHRLYQKQIAEIRRVRKSYGFLNLNTDRNYLEVDNQVGIGTDVWGKFVSDPTSFLFSGVHGSPVATLPYNINPAEDEWRLEFPVDSWLFDNTHFHSSPTAAWTPTTTPASPAAVITTYIKAYTGTLFVDLWAWLNIIPAPGETYAVTFVNAGGAEISRIQFIWFSGSVWLVAGALSFNYLPYCGAWQKLSFEVGDTITRFLLNDVFISNITNSPLTPPVSRIRLVASKPSGTLGKLWVDDLSYHAEHDITRPRHYTMFGDYLNLSYLNENMMKRVWDLTGRELDLVADITAGATSMLVKNKGLSKNFQGYERLYILTGTKLWGRKILSITEISEDVERVVFNQAVTAIARTDVVQAGIARFCVLDSEPEYEFQTSTVMVTTLELSEVNLDEYEELE